MIKNMNLKSILFIIILISVVCWAAPGWLGWLSLVISVLSLAALVYLTRKEHNQD